MDEHEQWRFYIWFLLVISGIWWSAIIANGIWREWRD